MSDLCIRCGKKPIAIKKRKLCRACYQKEYHKNGLSPKERTVTHFREMDFIKNFFTHVNWIYEPVTFRLNEERYTPDFYDAERNFFIEVVGTKQAYHQNKKKYQLFKRLYPKINFEIRTSDGEILKEKENST